MNLTEKENLTSAAKEAAVNSYSPYSHFRVGAALLCGNGEIIKGANIENRSYGLTNCAERSAFFTALSKGIKTFKAIAVYSPDSPQPLPPCGACRQVISEFVSEDFPILLMGRDSTIVKTMKELLPMDSLHELKET